MKWTKKEFLFSIPCCDFYSKIDERTNQPTNYTNQEVCYMLSSCTSVYVSSSFSCLNIKKGLEEKEEEGRLTFALKIAKKKTKQKQTNVLVVVSRNNKSTDLIRNYTTCMYVCDDPFCLLRKQSVSASSKSNKTMSAISWQ